MAAALASRARPHFPRQNDRFKRLLGRTHMPRRNLIVDAVALRLM
jgi:hypothetical protein